MIVNAGSKKYCNDDTIEIKTCNLVRWHWNWSKERIWSFIIINISYNILIYSLTLYKINKL